MVYAMALIKHMHNQIIFDMLPLHLSPLLEEYFVYPLFYTI